MQFPFFVYDSLHVYDREIFHTRVVFPYACMYFENIESAKFTGFFL